ncbi:hypothetical protein MRX96_048531 [Rhipicephalus microplus]
MFRVPILFLALSVGLMTVGSVATPFDYISSGFRSLAEYKLATTARLASYLTGDRAVKATVDLKVAAVPEETTEEAAIGAPVVAGPLEVVHHDEESPAKQHLTITTLSDEELNNFKKQFTTGYAALNYADQLQKTHRAGAASTKPQYFTQPVILPLEDYKGYVNGGQTGGELMRVALLAQDIPKPFFPSQDLSGAQQEQAQLNSSYQLPAAATDADTQSLDSHDDITVEVNSTGPIRHDEIVIPGSQFPEQTIEGTSDAEPALEGAAVVATPSPETAVPDQESRQRRDVADGEEEADDDQTRFPVPGTNLTIQGADVETYFRYLKKHDASECLAKIFCLMAARPAAFGTNGTMMTDFFTSYKPMPGHTSIAFYKEASLAGSQGGDCHDLFDKCTMSVEEMKAAFNHDVGL